MKKFRMILPAVVFIMAAASAFASFAQASLTQAINVSIPGNGNCNVDTTCVSSTDDTCKTLGGTRYDRVETDGTCPNAFTGKF